MRERFTRLWERICAHGDTETAYERLQAIHAEPPRHYHTFHGHISECLDALDDARHLLHDPDAAEWALMHHDAYYDTHRNDNEERSALLAYSGALIARLPHGFAIRAHGHVMATTHDHAPEDTDSCYVADIDLAPLAKTWEAFREDTHAIRREYAWVPEDTFWTARKEILRGFLDRDQLYLTAHFREHHEEAARENLRRATRD